MSAAVEASFDFCRRVVRQSKSNFSLAFRLLPPDQRRGMDALYAWLRLTDDIADGPGAAESKKKKLCEWRQATFETSRDREGAESVLPALHATIRQFQIPTKHLSDVLDGVESDLLPRPFASFTELEPYCHQVASSVGLACLCIWGVRDSAAEAPAKAAGVAFQLTNILRDLGEDFRNGRVYLPSDELERFHFSPDHWQREAGEFDKLMQFQINRARNYYRQSESLDALLPRRARAMFAAMRGIYSALLDKIEREPSDVLHRRVRVSRLRKMRIAAVAWLDASRNAR